MNEQVLDVRATLRILRRAWRALIVVSLVGAVLGGAYGVTRPPTYAAEALVLLPSTGATTGAGAANSVTTDAQIATSAAVLVPAARTLAPDLSPAAIRNRVKASASTTASVLAISATGTSAGGAERLANAVADQLVSFVTASASASVSSTVQALRAQEKSLNQKLSTVQAELGKVQVRLGREGTNTPRGSQDATLLQNYTSEQTNLQLQVNGIESQISQTEVTQASANQGTQVISRATSASASRWMSIATKSIAGLLGGFLLASGVVIVRRRRDARLLTRDDLAAALGSPVVLSLATHAQRSASGWVEMFERYEPSSSEQWSVRKALREVGVVDGRSSHLEILMLAGDTAAAALTVQTAISVAAAKTDTAFSFVDTDTLPALRSACQRLAQRDESPRSHLEVNADDDLAFSTPGLTIVGRTIVGRTVEVGEPVEAQRGGGQSLRFATTTVLAVTAGMATADQLARVAIAAADHGRPIRAVFVADPASDDQTTGRFPEAANRATLVLHRRTIGVVGPGRRPGPARLGLAGASPAAISSAPGESE